jgi:hypothetical protein
LAAPVTSAIGAGWFISKILTCLDQSVRIDLKF